MKEKMYLLVIEGDVEPFVKGPYEDAYGRLRAARRIRRKSDEDGVFRLNINAKGEPEVYSFSGSEIEGTR